MQRKGNNRERVREREREIGTRILCIIMSIIAWFGAPA